MKRGIDSQRIGMSERRLTSIQILIYSLRQVHCKQPKNTAPEIRAKTQKQHSDKAKMRYVNYENGIEQLCNAQTNIALCE